MRKTPLTIDEALVLGEDYAVGGGITIRQPTIEEVVRYGEASYYRVVGLLTAISSDCKAALNDMGLDWCKVTDFSMFVLSTRSLTQEDTYMLFGDELDLSKCELFASDDEKIELRSPDGKFVIDEECRAKLSSFLCRMHQITKKPEFPANDFAREMLLDESREEARKSAEKPPQLILPTLISFIANAPGSKYDYDTCKQLKYSVFMDAVSRIQIIGNASALRSACYSGMIDTSKIDKSELNMMREITYGGEREVVTHSTNTKTIRK